MVKLLSIVMVFGINWSSVSLSGVIIIIEVSQRLLEDIL